MGSATAVSAPSAAPVLRIRPPPAWTPEEDARLERLAREHGFRHWRRVAARMVPGRSSRECRGRWRNHLARDVYHRPFTARDDDDLARLYVRHGGRWREMSRAVHGRTSRVMRRRWREVRDSDAFLSRLWRPRSPVSAPAHQDAAVMEPSLQQQPVFTCVGQCLLLTEPLLASFRNLLSQ
ncbi:hypothetical protein GQ55_1G271400 [Panicum hallii var. hallii]|uniref:Myb-like domain-containing protein n=1 Tax=Panicum hallii var. hallii TaxID=1504633 RepID=A0A2T7F816_9POAL|nr:hypothetical protein GQ55_1G271400 [Panicum hallii var. hallii]